MDNMSLEMENDGMENNFHPRHFSSSWNEIICADSNFDLQTFNSMLAGEISNTSLIDFENTLVNPQEIISVDPNSAEQILSLIKDEAVPVSSTFISQPASLPASQDWPGLYDFNIGFNVQEKKTKGVTWTYNPDRKKLHVGKDAPCPVNFSTNCWMDGVQIRAMALYSSPESARVVERCMNHVGEDRAKNIDECEHLVRCESPMAMYDMDPTTKRYSVVIPFENPPPGQSFSTYIFKFACFSSCFGPNRRPLMLVFSLEKDNQCIGRQRIDVKICANPGRDSKTGGEPGPSRKRKKKTIEPGSSNTLPSSNTNPSHSSKKSKGMSDDDGHYKIMVKDRKCFEFLEQMRKYYNIVKTIRSLPPDIKRVVEQYQQRKGYHVPDELNLSS